MIPTSDAALNSSGMAGNKIRSELLGTVDEWHNLNVDDDDDDDDDEHNVNDEHHDLNERESEDWIGGQQREGERVLEERLEGLSIISAGRGEQSSEDAGDSDEMVV